MQIKFIGTEDGRGIPSAGCQCERCNIARDKGGKDYRSRVSIIVSNGSETILYDTPSTIGSVLNEERIFHISAIFLSHKHFDHIGGITEFEYWPHIIPVYGNISVLGNFEITDGLLFRQDGKRIVHFNDKADQETFKKIARWAYLFESMDADRIKPGYGGLDISRLEKFGVPTTGLVVDAHRYFDYHHSDHDTFDKVNERELELNAAAMAILAYVLAMEGIESYPNLKRLLSEMTFRNGF